jgi:transcriptional regulator with PAS, ATPase and Fis domain
LNANTQTAIKFKPGTALAQGSDRDQSFEHTGSFRGDLYYRLHVFPIEIPPLRERKEDIPLLVEYFIDRYARKGGKHITSVEKRTLEVLQSYPWPGNIQELQNVIERSVIVCETGTFLVDESWLSQPPVKKSAEEPALSLSSSRKLDPARPQTSLYNPGSSSDSLSRFVYLSEKSR